MFLRTYARIVVEKDDFLDKFYVLLKENMIRGSSVGRATRCGYRSSGISSCVVPYTQMSRKDTRLYSDRAEYLKKYVIKRRRVLKAKAIEHKGGQCLICGYRKTNGALTFHHKNPKTKSFGLSARGVTRSWSKVQKELDKCVLLCANCHAEVHDGVTQLPKET
jgi:5-methylcytosine-specific restriction endonuclease McrA